MACLSAAVIAEGPPAASVTCTARTRLVDRIVTGKDIHPWRDSTRSFQPRLSDANPQIVEDEYALANSPYFIHYRITFAPGRVTPFSSGFALDTRVTHIDDKGRKRLLEHVESPGLRAQSDAPVVASFRWDNPDFVNLIMDADFTYNEAEAIASSNDTRFLKLVKDGRIPDGMIMEHLFSCSKAP